VAELRTWWSGVDPGLTRLRLASIAVAAMVLAVGVMSAVRALGGYSVTVVLFAAVLAMVSNLSVNEPDPARRRATTAWMVLPACASVAAGTLLAPHRIPADVVFVVIMMVAVWVRRFGPRGTALGMAAFMGYFFTQFLGATVAELPWLLLAVLVGVLSTLVLRTWLFVERPERTLDRLLRALRARVHALLREVAKLLSEEPDADDDPERWLADLRRARARLNDTALLIADQLDRAAERRADEDGEPDQLTLLVLDAELAAERLAVATSRMLAGPDPVDRPARAALTAGVRWLEVATAAGASPAVTAAGRTGAEGAVAGLVQDVGQQAPDRVQRVAFAVTRLAEALDLIAVRSPGEPAAGRAIGHTDGTGGGGHDPAEGPGRRAEGADDRAEETDDRAEGRAQVGAGDQTDRETDDRAEDGIQDRAGDRAEHGTEDRAHDRAHDRAGDRAHDRVGDRAHDRVGDRAEDRNGDADPPRRELALATRQTVQVGVATSLAIIAGELVSPSRWYWAVITAFVVFAGTTSRGDLLSRGLQRLVGTVGGVLAGMALAALIGGAPLPALVLMFVCVFLALYLMRLSQALMAFWITTVLALLYGLIGQFSTHTLLVRVEETAIGATLGILAGFLILPKRTRDVFAEALDAVVDAADEVLAAAADRLTGRPTDEPPVVLARRMGTALGDLRARVRPLDNPLPGRRGRTSYHRALRVLTAVDHYARATARASLVVSDPGWAPTLVPAVDQARANVRALCGLVLHREHDKPTSAEELIDAAEGHAARAEPPTRRHTELVVTRMVRRLDQVVVGFAADLGEPVPGAAAGATDGRKIR
jgi:uncharacterized membrane protein YccC